MWPLESNDLSKDLVVLINVFPKAFKFLDAQNVFSTLFIYFYSFPRISIRFLTSMSYFIPFLRRFPNIFGLFVSPL